MKNESDKKQIIEKQAHEMQAHEMQDCEKQEYEKMKLRLVSRNGVDVVCASGGNTEEDWFDDNVDAGGWT